MWHFGWNGSSLTDGQHRVTHKQLYLFVSCPSDQVVIWFRGNWIVYFRLNVQIIMDISTNPIPRNIHIVPPDVSDSVISRSNILPGFDFEEIQYARGKEISYSHQPYTSIKWHVISIVISFTNSRWGRHCGIGFNYFLTHMILKNKYITPPSNIQQWINVIS